MLVLSSIDSNFHIKTSKPYLSQILYVGGRDTEVKQLPQNMHWTLPPPPVTPHKLNRTCWSQKTRTTTSTSRTAALRIRHASKIACTWLRTKTYPIFDDKPRHNVDKKRSQLWDCFAKWALVTGVLREPSKINVHGTFSGVEFGDFKNMGIDLIRSQSCPVRSQISWGRGGFWKSKCPSFFFETLCSGISNASSNKHCSATTVKINHSYFRYVTRNYG